MSRASRRSINSPVKYLCVLLIVGSVALAQSALPELARLKLAAEAGDARAQHTYAQRIMHSNSKESFEYNLKSANQGFGPAEDMVGAHYLSKAPYNVKERAKMERLGARYASRAAFKGIPNAQANLSECYDRGTGVPRNPARAYAWMAIAARPTSGANSIFIAGYRSRLDQLVARTPSSAIAEGQKLADAFRPGGSGMNSVEADILVAQMKINAIILVRGAKTVVVNQTRVPEGETNTLTLDGETVSLRCISVGTRSAKFQLGEHTFMLMTN